MMRPWLFVGARVVFTGFRDKRPSHDVLEPVAGSIYTVRGIIEGWNGSAVCTGIWLEEIVNSPRVYDNAGRDEFIEKSWDAVNFKPLHDVSQTIEALKQLMINGPQDEPVDFDKVLA